MRSDWTTGVKRLPAIWRGIVFGGCLLASAQGTSAHPTGTGAHPGFVGAQPGWWEAVTARIHQEEYRPSRDAHGLQAPNRANHLRTRFRAGGIDVAMREGEDAGAQVTWRTESWGRARTLSPVEGAAAPVVANEGDLDIRKVVYAHAGFDEWYINGPDGVEQGFTIHQRPRGQGPLILRGRFGGVLEPVQRGKEPVLAFINDDGRELLHYGKLHVYDADGRALPSRFDLDGRELSIQVDDGSAAYPITIDPLIDAPDWVEGGSQEGSEFGLSCGTAGDVNGDGYSDVIVSAPYFDGGEADEGRVFVYLGSPSGLSEDPAWHAEPDLEGAAFGLTTAAAGDVNGDGYSDVLVGSWMYNNGQQAEGCAFLYLGSPSGPEATPAWSIEGNREVAAIGMSLATAGDVNADGYSDVVIGAIRFGGAPESGFALVYHGSAQGLGALPAWVKSVNVLGSGVFGWSVGTAGDVNGDGFGDLIVSSGAGGNPDGAVYVYHGSPDGLFTSHAWSRFSDQDTASFGYSVMTAGDVNGDGYADVIIGAPLYDSGEEDEGRVYLYQGSADGLLAAPSWFQDGGQIDGQFGRTVAPAGDVNGDGFADIMAGTMRHDGAGVDQGRAVLYLGSASGLAASPEWQTEGSHAQAYLGCSLGTAGDVNGDGFSDLIVGEFGYSVDSSYAGRALVFHGAPHGLSASAYWRGESNQVNARYGNAVAAADVNGDGYSDVFVAASEYDEGQAEEGAVYGYHGSPLGLPFSPRWLTQSNQAAALLGWKKGLASAGDVNGDGYDDLITGAPLFDNGHDNEGKVWVYHGSSVGVPFFPSWTAEPDAEARAFGICVAAAGDVNGDGFGDVIVGSDPSVLNGDAIGRVDLYHGSPSGLGVSPAWSVADDQPGSGFGAAVASAGDVNGDGYSDVIVGAPSHDQGQADEGRAFLYLGGPAGLSTEAAWTVAGDQAMARLGSAVAGAGDVNGDGYSDVIVAAELYDGGETDEGRAWIYAGSPAGLLTEPIWMTESNQPHAGRHIAVATGGDVNADGYSDALVGFSEYDNGQSDEGVARLFLGSAAGPSLEPSWQIDPNQSGAYLGISVASAGDVNADGFGDVIIGADGYTSGQGDEGAAVVYLGNGRGGLERIAQQARSDDSARIAALGRSDSESAFRIRTYARTAAGRGLVRLEYEIKTPGLPFDGDDLITGSLIDTGTPHGGSSAVQLSELVQGLLPGTLYHWRARLVSDSPFFPRSPWFTLPENAGHEGDVRAGGSISSNPNQDNLTSAAGERLLEPLASPFEGALRISYRVPESGRARLTVHDVTGRMVALLHDEFHHAGVWSSIWDTGSAAARGTAAGVYYVRLTIGKRTETRKVVLAG